MSLPSIAEVEHADWPSLQRMAESLGLNPKGRSVVVRMRVADYVRRRSPASSWRPSRGHQAALLSRLGFSDLATKVWESTIRLDEPAPWVGLGQAQLSSGLPSEARKSYARASAMGDLSAHLHRAEALAASGDFEAASRACDEYLAAVPRDLRGLLMKASFLARGAFEGEAMKVLQTAIDLHPGASGLWRAVGKALLRANHPAPAVEALQGAAQRRSDDVDAQVAHGAALLLAGRAREALDLFRQSLKADRRGPATLNNLGVAYLAAGRLKSASNNLKRAAKLHDSPRILLNLARVQERLDKPEEARQLYEKVLRLRPADPEALAGRTRLPPSTKGTDDPGTPLAGSKKSRPRKRKVADSIPPPPAESPSGS